MKLEVRPVSLNHFARVSSAMFEKGRLVRDVRVKDEKLRTGSVNVCTVPKGHASISRVCESLIRCCIIGLAIECSNT